MTTDENPGWALRWMREHYAALLITEDPSRVRLVTNPHDDGLSYYELPDGRRFPVPVDPRAWNWSDELGDREVLPPRRAEQMINMSGVASAETANDYARRLISEHLGQEAVAGLEEADISTRLEYSRGGGVVQILETPNGDTVTVPLYGIGFRSAPAAAPLEEGAMEEMARFEWTIKNLDPADSAWNPVTGLEPVLCRVCGNSSDPRTGKVLEHPDRYPCAPRVEEANSEGGTTQVRDLVLLRSANMREELPFIRDGLNPEEVLEISVQAFVDAGFRGLDGVPAGPVRECLYCLAISRTPAWTVQHDDHRCASDGYVVAIVDPNELDVAAIHLPGARSITDPAWLHLEAGWWVAQPGTPAPGWAEAYHESVPLPKVAHWAIKPTDLTPVRLSGPDREHSRTVAGHLTRLAEYFRALDRPETVHGITALTQAIGTAVRQSWDALQALHAEDDGALIHAGLGSVARCSLCPPRDSEATERRMETLAQTIHARMAEESQGRALTVREVWVILDHLLAYRAWEDVGAPYFTLAEAVAGQINNRRLVRQVTGVQRRIFTADVASVVRAYRRHLAAGGDRGPVRPETS